MLSFFRIGAASLVLVVLGACATSTPPVSDDKPASARRASGSAGDFQAEPGLTLCPRQSVSNAPSTDSGGAVRGYRPVVNIQGAALLVNPAPGSCLSSAFGTRNGRLHKGVDYQADPAGPVLAAGAGTVVEAGYRDDYGQYVLIEHGNGVYTRYAHLARMHANARTGARVQMGSRLGVMGNTAGYRIPVHLHYEVLLGNYATPAASFGLQPIDILQRM